MNLSDPNAGFVVAAYVIALVVIGAMIFGTLLDQHNLKKALQRIAARAQASGDSER